MKLIKRIDALSIGDIVFLRETLLALVMSVAPSDKTLGFTFVALKNLDTFKVFEFSIKSDVQIQYLLTN